MVTIYFFHSFCLIIVDKVNAKTVGVKNEHKIANSSMTASSWKLPGYFPHAARFDDSIGSGSWCAANNKQGEYLEVDLGRQLTISKVAAQGDSITNSGVTHFSIAHAENGVQFRDYRINGVVKVRMRSISFSLQFRLRKENIMTTF